MSPSGFRPLSIAVISDLHIGDARGADLYPDTAAYVDRRKAPVVTDEQYVEKFAAFVTRNGIEADYLVVPGDVSNGAEAAQVLLGAQVLQRCASALHVPEERILFVPGNHDVNWEMLREDDTTGLYWGLRFAAFTSPSSWFRQLGAMGDPELYEAPYFSIREFDNLLAVGYNSAWAGRGRLDEVQHGYISPEQIDQIDDRLRAIPRANQQIRMFMLHHHPITYHDPTNWRDFSSLQNASMLIDLLAKHHFDLLVHGHKHQPALKPISQATGPFLAILAAGSFSSVMFHGWAGSITNQFHLIKVEGRSPLTGQASGFVQSWAYLTGHGWKPSVRERHGIDHCEGFGEYLATPALTDLLRRVVSVQLDTHNFVKWSQITLLEPTLRNVPQGHVRNVLDALRSELNFEIIPADELILLRLSGTP